jgi:arginase family enzyme
MEHSDVASAPHGAAFLAFAGRCADRNARGMEGVVRLGDELAQRLGRSPAIVGRPELPLGGGWRVELDAAGPQLHELARALDQALTVEQRSLTLMARCASGLATLPIVARHRPDACVVWFDAHGDMNTPATSVTGYLGGMVISGACGLWPTGFGDDLTPANVVLVGARDIDDAERELIEAERIVLVPPGPGLAQRVARAVRNRPVYIHLDCDVLEPGLVPTEFSAPSGVSFEQLEEALAMLAAHDVVGLETAEFEATWPDGRAGDPSGLIAALGPMLDAIFRAG